LPFDLRRGWIESGHRELAIGRQCELAGISRSGYYYVPCRESEVNLTLMRRLDEQYTATPFYGIRRMTAWLLSQGYAVNHKRVARLMRALGLQVIYPKPKLSQGHPGHTKYPYLLRELVIERANQVWSADITYIRLAQGFVYLVAILDWFSRYVLAWALSIAQETAFCLQALGAALQGGRPEIFNTDQGAQFTSREFTGILLDAEVRISMDGRGRALDNVFVERLWRSVKYEEVYLNDYASVAEAEARIRRYFEFYNRERLHQSLGYRTPYEVHYDR
jgi:putative transposase